PMRRVLPLGILLLALTLTASACSGSSVADSARPVPISGEMPSLSGATLQGGRLDPADYRGTITVVSFWSSWCSPCERELPSSEMFWNAHRADGVSVIGVNWRDQSSDAKAQILSHDLTYPSLFDPYGSNSYRWPDFATVPITYVSDATGHLRYLLNGEVNQ